MKFDELAGQIISALQSYVQRAIAPISARLKAAEESATLALEGFRSLPTPEEMKGKDGLDGKDADPAKVEELIAAAVKALPAAKDGIDGKDADMGVIETRIQELVKQAADSLPRPADGQDGKDADPEQIRLAVEKALEAMPKPLDGKKGDDGQDGEPGRDAAQIDVLDSVEMGRRYQRGTFALHAGGMVRARRATDPLVSEDADLERAGWQVILRGLASVDAEIGGDDGRTVSLQLRMTDGTVVKKTAAMPVTIHRDVWRAEGYEIADGVFKAYERGDQVTRDGSQWTLMADHEKGAPGTEDSGWRLSCKRGRDGRDGLKGEKGRDGRNLTREDLAPGKNQ